MNTFSAAVLPLVRGIALAGLALAGLLVLAGTWLSRILGLVFPIEWGRAVPKLARRLAREWSGVTVPEPYLPPPPAPVRRPDGRYLAGSTLYKNPRWAAYHDRWEWVVKDPATSRDDLWLLVNPVVGGALALAPAALAGLGLYGVVSGGSAAARALGAVVACAGILVGPLALRLYGRWTRLLVAPSNRRPGYRNGVGLVRCAALLGLSVLALALFVCFAVATSLAFGLGLVFLFPPLVEHSRWLPGLRRQLAADWAGVDIPAPYRPRPPAPEPDADGLYREGSTVYRTPRVPAFTRRWQWVVGDAATWRDLAWLLLDPLAAALLVLPPLALAGYGLWALAWQSVWTALGFGDGGGRAGGYGAVVDRPWLAVPLGIALVVLGAVLAPTAVRLHSRWARALLAPTERARLAQRVQQLAETRADATDAQAAELRRIERDLHDGAQARLVAVGLSLGTIEQLMDRDPEAAKALLAQARETSARALAELRDLVRGVHPPVLAERGLVDAIRALALDSPLPVTVDVDLPVRSEPPVEAAAYFAVAEMLANAARHSGARSVRVDLRNAEDRLRITVADDGQGGADPARGSGLRGIQRRLGTFDGTMTVASPPGGPTTVTMEIPCALSSPRTSTS